MKRLLWLLVLIAVAVPAWAQDIDTFYIKTDDDTYIRVWSIYWNANYGTATTIPLGTGSSTANVGLLRFVNAGSVIGDSLYFVAAKLGLYVSTKSTNGRITLRKLCRRYDEGTATWIHYDKRAGADLAWTTAGGLSLAECAGAESTGDSTGTDTDDDYTQSDSITATGWTWIPIDSLNALDRMDANDSLTLHLYSSTFAGSVYSSDYTTDTTLTPRLMLIVQHIPDAPAFKPGLHDGEIQTGYLHHGDKVSGRMLHRGDL